MVISVDQTRKIISAANAALAVAVAFSVLLIARDAVVLSGSGGKAMDETAGAKDASRPYTRTINFRGYAPVLENNVFGFDAGKLYPISSATALEPQMMASPASVALQVFGTVAWDGGTGYAFIKDDKGKQAVVKTGQDIPGSGRLERVYADRIIVSFDGRELEVNTIQVQPASNAPKDETAAAGGASGAGRASGTSGASGDGFARRTGEGQYVVDRIAVEESINNPERLMKDARMLPHFNKNREQEGFTLSEVKPGGVYHTLGLKNGDILLGVNGLELSDPASALQAFTAIKGANRIKVDIVRNGSPMTLRYTLR